MFCSNCGKPIADNSLFCPECGAKICTGAVGTQTVPTMQAQPVPNAQNYQIQGQRITENVYLCGDGVYRWAYEYKLMSNPTILFTILKVLGLSIGITYALVALMMLFDGNTESIGGLTLVFAIITAVLFVIGFISYVIYAAINGWKYCVMFEMDEYGVTHKQMGNTANKASVIQDIAVMAGVLTGNLAMTGNALMIRTSMRSDFRNVRNIKVIRGRHTIKVNCAFEKNQVYADPADFDFVLNFISARIPPNAQRK